MIHVLKQSKGPIQIASVLRAGGPNNIAPLVREPVLVLWSAQSFHRFAGRWDYLLDFEPRHTSHVGELARVMGYADAGRRYDANIDWRSYLGDDWALVDEARRARIIQEYAAAPSAGPRILSIRPGTRAPAA